MVHHGQPRTRRSGADLQSPSHGVLDQDVVDQGVEERFASRLRSIATRTCSARSDSSCGVGG